MARNVFGRRQAKTKTREFPALENGRVELEGDSSVVMKGFNEIKADL